MARGCSHEGLLVSVEPGPPFNRILGASCIQFPGCCPETLWPLGPGSGLILRHRRRVGNPHRCWGQDSTCCGHVCLGHTHSHSSAGAGGSVCGEVIWIPEAQPAGCRQGVPVGTLGGTSAGRASESGCWVHRPLWRWGCGAQGPSDRSGDSQNPNRKPALAPGMRPGRQTPYCIVHCGALLFQGDTCSPGNALWDLQGLRAGHCELLVAFLLKVALPSGSEPCPDLLCLFRPGTGTERRQDSASGLGACSYHCDGLLCALGVERLVQ